MIIKRSFVKFVLFLFFLIIILNIISAISGFYKSWIGYVLILFLIFLAILFINKKKPYAGSILIFIFVLAVIGILIFTVLGANLFFVVNKDKSINARVTRVISGNSFEIEGNRTIRLICVKIPEEGDKGYKDSKIFLNDLILGREVRLEKDEINNDEDGRLLRYVYVNIEGSDIFVNKEIVKNKFGEVLNSGNNTKRCNEIAD
jgi:endonuclease YncB( thermonuclease family)